MPFVASQINLVVELFRCSCSLGAFQEQHNSNQTANNLLGYTALMGVQPKVQPTFADSNDTANKLVGYTALVGVPPNL